MTILSNGHQWKYTEFTDKDRQAIFDDEIRIQAQKIREKKQNQQ